MSATLTNLYPALSKLEPIKRGQDEARTQDPDGSADIKMIRNKLNKSQSEFALMIGVNVSHFAELGAGTSATRRACSGPAEDCVGKSRNGGTVVKRLSTVAQLYP